MNDKEYFTFKTKDEVLEINKEDVENKGYEIKTVKIDDVYVSYIPHFNCIPDLRIEANSCIPAGIVLEALGIKFKNCSNCWVKNIITI